MRFTSPLVAKTLSASRIGLRLPSNSRHCASSVSLDSGGSSRDNPLLVRRDNRSAGCSTGRCYLSRCSRRWSPRRRSLHADGDFAQPVCGGFSGDAIAASYDHDQATLNAEKRGLWHPALGSREESNCGSIRHSNLQFGLIVCFIAFLPGPTGRVRLTWARASPECAEACADAC